MGGRLLKEQVYKQYGLVGAMLRKFQSSRILFWHGAYVSWVLLQVQ